MTVVKQQQEDNDNSNEEVVVDLSQIKTKDKLHALMNDLGFTKKSPEQIQAATDRAAAAALEKELRRLRLQQHNYDRQLHTDAFRVQVMQQKPLSKQQKQRQVDVCVNHAYYRRKPDMVVENYRIIFGDTYLTAAQRLAKAQAFLNRVPT